MSDLWWGCFYSTFLYLFFFCVHSIFFWIRSPFFFFLEKVSKTYSAGVEFPHHTDVAAVFSFLFFPLKVILPAISKEHTFKCNGIANICIIFYVLN